MRRVKKIKKTVLEVCDCYEGKTLEQQIQRVMERKEQPEARDQMIYTERKDGVLPQHDIRTDRWDVALDATNKVAKSYRARREDRHNPPETNTETTTEN